MKYQRGDVLIIKGWITDTSSPTSLSYKISSIWKFEVTESGLKLYFPGGEVIELENDIALYVFEQLEYDDDVIY